MSDGLLQLHGQLSQVARLYILLAVIKSASSCEANITDAAAGLQ